MSRYKKKADQPSYRKGKEGTQAKKRVYTSVEDFNKYSPDLIKRWSTLYDVEVFEQVEDGSWQSLTKRPEPSLDNLEAQLSQENQDWLNDNLIGVHQWGDAVDTESVVKKLIEMEQEVEQLKSITPLELIIKSGYQNFTHFVCDSLVHQFEESGADNFVTMTFDSPDGEYELVMSRVSGESTTEQLGRLKDEIASLKSQHTGKSTVEYGSVSV